MMVGEKLTALTHYLLEKNLCASETLDSYMDDVRLRPVAQSLGQGIVIARLEYDAIIDIERYHGKPASLFAHLAVWLGDNDEHRFQDELPPPQLEIDALDFDTADIQITIEFFEDIQLVPNENGDIDFHGQKWSVATVPIDSANEVAVGDNEARDTDAPYRN